MWPRSRQIIITIRRSPTSAGPVARSIRVHSRADITVMENDNISAYAHQFSAGMSRMVGRDFSITADTIIVQRRADRDTVDPTLPDPVTRVRPYPQFARVNYWQATADNDYTLLLKFESA